MNKTVNVFLSWGLESSEKIYIKHTTASGPWEGIKGRLGLVEFGKHLFAQAKTERLPVAYSEYDFYSRK